MNDENSILFIGTQKFGSACGAFSEVLKQNKELRRGVSVECEKVLGKVTYSGIFAGEEDLAFLLALLIESFASDNNIKPRTIISKIESLLTQANKSWYTDKEQNKE